MFPPMCIIISVKIGRVGFQREQMWMYVCQTMQVRYMVSRYFSGRKMNVLFLWKGDYYMYVHVCVYEPAGHLSPSEPTLLLTKKCIKKKSGTEEAAATRFQKACAHLHTSSTLRMSAHKNNNNQVRRHAVPLQGDKILL